MPEIWVPVRAVDGEPFVYAQALTAGAFRPILRATDLPLVLARSVILRADSDSEAAAALAARRRLRRRGHAVALATDPGSIGRTTGRDTDELVVTVSPDQLLHNGWAQSLPDTHKVWVHIGLGTLSASHRVNEIAVDGLLRRLPTDRPIGLAVSAHEPAHGRAPQPRQLGSLVRRIELGPVEVEDLALVDAGPLQTHGPLLYVGAQASFPIRNPRATTQHQLRTIAQCIVSNSEFDGGHFSHGDAWFAAVASGEIRGSHFAFQRAIWSHHLARLATEAGDGS